MYKRIIVPLDGSKVAESVLPSVREIAGALQSEIALLRVIEPTLASVQDYVSAKYYVGLEEALTKEARSYLENVSDYLKDNPGIVTTKVTNGNPSEKIVEEASSGTSDLVAMATHGRSGIGRWALGSVTDGVLHSIGGPILVVRAQEKKVTPPKVNFKSLVVPLDGSETAEIALSTGSNLAKAIKLQVTLVRVVPTIASYYGLADYPNFNLGNYPLKSRIG